MSPVIATLLLIVIAVAAAVLVYMWTVGYATQMKPTTPETGERLKIEAGRLFRETATSNNVNATLYVRNVGGSPVYINASYLLTPAGSVVDTASASMYMKEIYVIDATGYSQPATLMALEPSRVYTVKIRFTNAWSSVTPDATYIVKIVTSLGSEFRIELRAQGASISAFKFYSTSYTMMSGSYVSGRLPESLVEVDGDCFVADAEPIQAEGSYTPSWLNVLEGSITEGDVEKLSSNDDQYLVVEPTHPPPPRKLNLSVGGSSNTARWVRLVWGASFKFDKSGVSVTLQLYNYAEGRYPTSGDGFISYTSQANVEQLVSQEIASNPERFRDADGSWRMLINATAIREFDAYFDHVFFNVTYKAYVVQPVFTFTGLKTAETTVKLAIDMASRYNLSSLPVEVALWNYRASRWDIVYTYTSNPSPGQLDAIRFEVASGAADYVSGSGEARLYVKATSSTGPFRQWIDMLRLTQYAR
jgi:hypothetical protein